MTKKPVILSKEIIYPKIAAYFKSGESPSSFYKREGLSEGQFYSWRKRYLRDHPNQMKPAIKESTQNFHPIEVPASKQLDVARGQIELEYPNGVILRMDTSLGDVRIASLIKLY